MEFVWDSEVKQLLRDQAVTGVRVRNKKTVKERDIPCDGVFVAVGYLPNTELYRGQVELDEAGYVLADETTQTNLPRGVRCGGLAEEAPAPGGHRRQRRRRGGPLYRGISQPVKKHGSPGGRVFAWVKEKRPSWGALFSGSVLLLPHEDEGRHFVAVAGGVVL